MTARKWLVLGLVMVARLLWAGSGAAQPLAPLAGPGWQMESPLGTPPAPREGMGIAIDVAHDRMILYGGKMAGPTVSSEVWVLKNASLAAGANSSWIQLTPTGGPPAGRNFGVTQYDPSSNRLIIHGGCSLSCSPARSDTWVLTNANGMGAQPSWIALPSAPVARSNAVGGYDPDSNQLIVFGGDQAFWGSERNDVWVLTNANGKGGTPQWIQLTPDGTPPAPRSWASGVYDASTNRLLVFGGHEYVQGAHVYVNDVWVLLNANGLGGTPEWVEVIPSGTLPAGRSNHAAAYDPTTRRLIAFGGYDGSNANNETWMLKNALGIGGAAAWQQLTPTGSLPPASASHGAAFSVAANRLVVFGGAQAGQSSNTVWLLKSANGMLQP